MRKCFTVNPFRKQEEIKDYQKVLIDKLYTGVEIFYPYQLSTKMQEQYYNAVKNYLYLDGVEFVCHLPYGLDNNLADMEKMSYLLERYQKAIDFASRFGVRKLTLHPGMVVGDCQNKDDVLQSIINASINIKQICQYAKKYQMVVMLENLIGEQELMRTADEYFQLKHLINEDNLAFIFDVAHFHASKFDDGNVENIINFVNQIKNDLMHIHVSDNDGTKDMHARIGIGNIDFSSYLKYLEQIGYKGLCSSEVLFNTSDDLKTTSSDIDECLK